MAIAKTARATLMETAYAVYGVEKFRYTIHLSNGTKISLRADSREEAMAILTEFYM